MFIFALMFSPLLTVVTSQVTAPALVVVGVLMAENLRNIDWDDFAIAAPSFLIVIGMPLTYSISDGMMIGLATQAGFMKDGKMPRAGRALMADAVGMTAGAILGTSPTSAYVESSSGMAVGGRSGLTSITTGIIGMVLTAIVGIISGLIDLPTHIVSAAPSLAPTFGESISHITDINTFQLWTVVLTFLIVTFFDTAGTDLKVAIAAGIGLFIAFIGLANAGLIVANESTMVSLGHLTSGTSLLAIFGIIVTFILIATRVPAAIFFMGLVARYPIAIAPGLGVNAFFAYSVVIGMKVPWQTAMAGVLIAAIIFLLLTFFKIRETIINMIPQQMNSVAKYFRFGELGTNFRTELIAGLTTFVSMAYILFVNPTVLGAAGMDKGAVFTATGVAAAIATIFSVTF
ncbi:hypothetical protein H7R52_02130 [Weissella confusa]|uniref:Guanine permease n=1 Tax=Weissella confusa TaxID=1583 RepID=A0A923NFU6_WEICO|nr:hypothetical protein [Weissella confusa]